MCKWLAFDTETHSWPDGDDTRRDLDVTCVAWALSDGPVFHYPTVVGEHEAFNAKMSRRELDKFAQRLCEYRAEGYRIATINGTGFDFPVLQQGVELLISYENLRDLALDSYDPAFQMLCERGFMVGLDALAVGLELKERKTEGMSGAKAVEMWETGNLDEQRQVIEYVRQDARVTLDIIQTIEQRGAISWPTKAGRLSHHKLERGLLSVRECLALPLPDTSWMTDPWPREKFSGWIK